MSPSATEVERLLQTARLHPAQGQLQEAVGKARVYDLADRAQAQWHVKFPEPVRLRHPRSPTLPRSTHRRGTCVPGSRQMG